MESSRNTINDIYEWDYNKENFIELKYENLITDFNTTIRNIFKHYKLIFPGKRLLFIPKKYVSFNFALDFLCFIFYNHKMSKKKCFKKAFQLKKKYSKKLVNSLLNP